MNKENNFVADRPKKLALFPPANKFRRNLKTMFFEKQGLRT